MIVLRCAVPEKNRVSMLWLEWVIQAGRIIDFRQRGSVACRPFPYALPLDGMSNIRCGSSFSLQMLLDSSMYGLVTLRICPHSDMFTIHRKKNVTEYCVDVRERRTRCPCQMSSRCLHGIFYTRLALLLVFMTSQVFSCFTHIITMFANSSPKPATMCVQADCIIIP